MTEFSLSVAAELDDVYVVDGLSQIQTSLLTLWVGNVVADGAPYTRAIGLRFQNVTVPKDTLIDQAYIVVRAWVTQVSVVVRAKLRGEAADNPSQFSTYADFGSRARTVAAVDWDISSNWIGNTYYPSPNISALIQEIVNRPNWASGNGLAIFVEDDGSDADAYRAVRKFYTTSGCVLYINGVAFGARRPTDMVGAYTPPISPTGLASLVTVEPTAEAHRSSPPYVPHSNQPGIPLSGVANRQQE